MSEGPVRLMGGWVAAEESEQLIVALFLNHWLCSVDRTLLPWEGSFFFLVSHSVFPSFYITSHLHHHQSLLWPSEIMACLLYDRHWILALLSFSVASPSGTLPQPSRHVWYALPCGVKSPQNFQKGSRQHEPARQTQLSDGMWSVVGDRVVDWRISCTKFEGKKT